MQYQPDLPLYLSRDSVAYLPNGLNGAVCVVSCPTVVNVATSCLADGGSCVGGTFTPTYSSFALESYCIPNSVGDNINIETIFNFDSYEQWAYELREGWPVLAVAVLAAIILSLLFFVFVRLCTGPVIWISIILCILGMLTAGIFFLLEAKGVVTADFVTQNLSSFSYNTLIIAGSCLIVASVLLTLLVICLRSRIAIGAKAVELGAMFLLSNCFLVILPVTQGFIIILALAGLVAGGIAILSMGDFSFPNNSAVPTISLNEGEIAMLVIFLMVGLWLVFFCSGCNSFMLCSAVSVWYFNTLNGGEGSPCGDSLWRMIRYHLGTVTFSSLFNGFLFIIKLLANLFSFDTKEDDGCLVSTCLKCLGCLFCVFKLYFCPDLGSCATSTMAFTFRLR